jgi:hypothetical protein
LNDTPRLANASMLGVFACVWPIAPTQSHKSSTAKKITFGDPLAETCGATPRMSATSNAPILAINTYQAVD